MAEKIGVENLKKVLGAVLHLSNKLDEVTKDGFQPVADLVALFPALADGVVLIKSGKEAWVEFQDLDDEEQVEINAYIKAEFDIADDKLEAVIESALLSIEAVADTVEKVRDALKK